MMTLRHLLKQGATKLLPCLLPSLLVASTSWASPSLAQTALVQTPGSLTMQTLSFAQLAAVQQQGQLRISPALQAALGYDPSRTWRAGTPLTAILQLADVDAALGAGALNVQAITQATGLDLASLPLSLFPLSGQQTLQHLAKTVPQLGDRVIRDFAPLRDLLTAHAHQSLQNLTLKQALQVADIGQLQLNQLDLSQYTFSDLPGLEAVPLQNLQGWQNTHLGQVPGLAQLPFGLFPKGPHFAIPGQFDIVLDRAEQSIQRTVSGSYQDGFQVPCTAPCSHLELGEPYLGWRWISGLDQNVRGGHGALAVTNGGVEPTGRHPFGDVFKVALTQTDATTGTAQLALYFRFCIKTALVDLGCSPYFLGPVPFLSVTERGWVPL